MRAPALLRGALVAALAAATPAAAAACAVCFGAADSKMTEGMNAGILALLGVVALVQVGFLAMFLHIRHRSRRHQEQRDNLQLIRGGMS